MRSTLLFLLLFVCGSLRADLISTDVPPGLQPPGMAIEDPEETWTIDGAGTDIWGTSDEFHYLFEEEPMSGDFAVGCHVVSFGGTPNNWGKAGIMVQDAGPDFLGPETYAFRTGGSGPEGGNGLAATL